MSKKYKYEHMQEFLDRQAYGMFTSAKLLERKLKLAKDERNNKEVRRLEDVLRQHNKAFTDENENAFEMHHFDVDEGIKRRQP